MSVYILSNDHKFSGAVGNTPNPGLCKEPTEHCDFQAEENSYHFSSLSDMSSSRYTLENTAVKTEARSESKSIITELKAGPAATQFTGRGRTCTQMNIKRPEMSRDIHHTSLGNDVFDVGNNFVSFTNSIETDIVRPKEYNIACQQSIGKSAETTELPRNNAESLPSKILSGFKSLLTSKSDRPWKSAEQNISNTSHKTAKESTEASYDSNPAVQNTNSTDGTIQKDTVVRKSTSDTGKNSQNTLEEETLDIIEHPPNDLKAELPHVSRLELSNENTVQTSTFSFPNGKFSSKNGVVTNKCPSDKELLEIAEVLGLKHEELGIRLGLPQSIIERCRGENVNNLKMQGFHILRTWFRKHKEASLDKLLFEMEECDIDTYDIKLNLGRL